jgi:hypothetical protein
MAIQEKSRTLYICRESLIISDIEYLTENTPYYLEENIPYRHSYYSKETYRVYDEIGNEHFIVNKDLLGKYFITMAEYRDKQIDSILE